MVSGEWIDKQAAAPNWPRTQYGRQILIDLAKLAVIFLKSFGIICLHRRTSRMAIATGNHYSTARWKMQMVLFLFLPIDAGMPKTFFEFYERMPMADRGRSSGKSGLLADENRADRK